MVPSNSGAAVKAGSSPVDGHDHDGILQPGVDLAFLLQILQDGGAGNDLYGLVVQKDFHLVVLNFFEFF